MGITAKKTKDRDAYENKLYAFLKETKEKFIKLSEEVKTKMFLKSRR